MLRPTQWILMLGALAALIGALIPAYRAVQRFSQAVARLETLVPFNVGGGRPIALAAFSDDGLWLAVAYEGGTASVWDLEHRREMAMVSTGPGPVTALALARPMRTLATAGQEGRVHLWDVATGRRIATLGGSMGRVLALAFSPDGSLLAMGDGGFPGGTGSQAAFGRVHLWNWRAGQRLAVTLAQSGPVVWLAFSADGRKVALGVAPSGPQGGSRFRVSVWNLLDGTQTGLPHPAGQFVEKAAFAPNGEMFATWGYAAPEKYVWVCPVAARTPWALREAPPDPVNALAFSPDGKTVAAGMRSGACLWDAATGQRRAFLKPGGGAGVEALGFTADGRLLHTLDGLGRVWRWNANTGGRARWAPRQP